MNNSILIVISKSNEIKPHLHSTHYLLCFKSIPLPSLRNEISHKKELILNFM